MALRVFWAQGGSQETNVWEVPDTLEVGSGVLSALSITLPSLPPAPHRGLSLNSQSESAEPGIGTQASSQQPYGPMSPRVNLQPLWVLCYLFVQDYQLKPSKLHGDLEFSLPGVNPIETLYQGIQKPKGS